MTEDLITFQFSRDSSSIIKVIGVGGGGCNAVNYMFEEGIRDVDFVVCNTDAQALENSPVPVRIQLGMTLTEGRGAGNRPEMGEEAARESYEDVKMVLEENTKMVFITAGMGGGTGTGAAPVIARLAHDMGILTIAVVTIPSPAEGKKRFSQAIEGIKKLSEHVDSMLVVSNQRLHSIYGDLPARQAFRLADNIVCTAVKGVAEIITVHGNINIDFADVYTVMNNSKVFIMGTGHGAGEGRALKAVKEALESPLLDDNSIRGTKNILLNIISGEDEITIGEIGEIIEYLQNEAGQEADIIWGNGYDKFMGDKISVTILCTGFRANPNPLFNEPKPAEKINLFDQQPPQRAPKPEPAPVLNLEEEPEPELTIDKNFSRPQVAREPKMVQPVKQPAPKVQKKKQAVPDSESSIDNWFYRKFGRLFEDDDQSL